MNRILETWGAEGSVKSNVHSPESQKKRKKSTILGEKMFKEM